MIKTGMFLAAAVEQLKPDPLSALIAAVAIAAVFVIFILIKKQTKRPEAVQPQAIPPVEEIIEAPAAKAEHIHFYKPEEIGVDDGELIAVLTAAIVAATGKSSSTFRVVSFRKKGDWSGNALRELINK